MIRKRNLGRRGALAGLFVALLVSSSQDAAAQDRSRSLIQPGPAPDLMLLFTGDVIGHLGPCG